MSWLLRNGEVLAALEVAEGLPQLARGLVGRRDLEGALLLRPCKSVHTVGVRFTIDVAYCDRNMKVLDMATMVPWRLGMVRPRARCVIEARAGAFERWRLALGDVLEIKG
jgi:uncharacterized protein